MRKQARKILFETLKNSGWEEVIFSNGKITDNSGLIETVIDGMIKFKNLTISDVSKQRELLIDFLNWYHNGCSTEEANAKISSDYIKYSKSNL